LGVGVKQSELLGNLLAVALTASAIWARS